MQKALLMVGACRCNPHITFKLHLMEQVCSQVVPTRPLQDPPHAHSATADNMKAPGVGMLVKTWPESAFGPQAGC
ncbi:hypothetical protein BST61_g3090 [Cercospora zeina]